MLHQSDLQAHLERLHIMFHLPNDFIFQDPTRPLPRAYEIIDKKMDAQAIPERMTT